MHASMHCPDDEALFAFAEGLASGAHHVALERHLDGCPGCRMIVAAAAEDGAAPDDDADDAREPGGHIGRYRVDACVGSGTMGVVYRAWDPELARPVAVKLVHARWARRPTARVRLAREARALAQLSDSNVLPVYDVGRHRDGLFIAMEFVEGRTLDQWCKGRSMREVVAVFVAAGRGLAAAHRAGLVHRDFKPTNVLMGLDGRPRVADFGLVSSGSERSTTGEDAADFAGDGRLTRAGSLVGTPRYMAPEQLRGETALPASDQFAFCVALYEAVFGAPPFDGSSPPELREAIERGPNVPSRSWPTRRLFALLEKGLRANPSGRHESLEHLLRGLDRLDRPNRPLVAGFVGTSLLAVAAPLGFGVLDDPCTGTESSLLVDDGPELPRIDASLRVHGSATFAASVSRELDDYASAWSQVYTAACSDAHERDASSSPALHCLETEKVNFEQFIELIIAQDASAQTASFTLGELGDPARCLDPRADAFDDITVPGLRSRLMRGRETLSRVSHLHGAGEFDAASATLDAAWDRLQRLPIPSLRTRAFLLRGVLQSDRGRHDDGAKVLEEAFAEATRHGLDTLALRIATRLMLVHIDKRQDIEAARRWDERASALATRSPSTRARAEHLKERARLMLALRQLDAALEAANEGLRLAEALDHTMDLVPSLDALIAGISLHQHDTRTARTHYEHVLDEYGAHSDGGHPNMATAFLGLAQVALAEADYEEAALLLDEAQMRTVADFGPQAWRLGTIAQTRASLEARRGNFGGALEQHRRAVEIEERERGPSDRRLRSNLRAMSLTLERLGDHAGALELRERVLVLAESADGVDSYDAALSQNNVAVSKLRLGQLAAAEKGFRRSLTVIEQHEGPRAAMSAYPLSGLGETLLERGQIALALPWLEKALVVSPDHDTEWASTAFVLARALWTPGPHRNPERALTLAAEAQRILGDAPDFALEHEQVSNWLATL